MSASERLAALLNAAETAERGWDNDLHGEPLLMALPEIVAVVRAAENLDVREYECDDGWIIRGVDRENEDEIEKSLRALDEKLADA